MNKLDLNINFQDFISDEPLTKDDIKFLRQELRHMKNDDLVNAYKELKANEKELSAYNRGVLHEIRNEIIDRNIAFNYFMHNEF